MRAVIALVVLLLAGPPYAGALRAEGERAGDFDYWVLSLSWSPTWCALEGRDRGSPQCDRRLGFVLHGLWPQYERGWPSFCRTGHRDPSRAETAAMVDIMGDTGAAWHQWRKHGRCSGLAVQDYYALSRLAFDAVTPPPQLPLLDRPVRLPARVVEEAFLAVNPKLSGDMVTITCRDGRIQEARICLTREMEPRRCGADVIRDCRLDNALLDPVAAEGEDG
jgi:ribonuclease T2